MAKRPAADIEGRERVHVGLLDSLNYNLCGETTITRIGMRFAGCLWWD